jgi:hypothetical protein
VTKAHCRGSYRRGHGVTSSKRSNIEQTALVSPLSVCPQKGRVDRVGVRLELPYPIVGPPHPSEPSRMCSAGHSRGQRTRQTVGVCDVMLGPKRARSGVSRRGDRIALAVALGHAPRQSGIVRRADSSIPKAVTSWPRSSSTRHSDCPMNPVPPATRTSIVSLLGGLSCKDTPLSPWNEPLGCRAQRGRRETRTAGSRSTIVPERRYPFDSCPPV